LYVISAHYRCCGQMGSTEDRQRQIQSDANVGWFRDLREPGGEITLPPGTPFVLCGDLNLVGGPQVLETLLTGKVANQAMFGPDSPPDWDGSPLADLGPLHVAGPLAYTWRDDSKGYVPGRLDAIVYTDSAMRAAKAFVLDTAEMSAADLKQTHLQPDDTAKASDHLPLVVDFDLAGTAPHSQAASQPERP
jgi:endonuclease/exonuclease/phosphatase family metal-dependent hydrolase